MGLGFDAGTYNLVKAARGEDDKVEIVRQVNAFIEIGLEDPFTFKMLKNIAKVPLVERNNKAYAMGEEAVSIARAFGTIELRRPMKDGCVNPSEKDGFGILATMIHGMIGEVKKNNEVLCYTIPANALNNETDADYHSEVLKQIFEKYSMNGKKLRAYPINEALALVYAELQHKFLTGVGISLGAGMINVCYANRSIPVFQFSIVNSGDWIDKQAAKAAAVSTTVINREKEKVDLMVPPTSEIERAIQTQYRILIRNTVKGIKEGFEKAGNKAQSDHPVDIVIAGGTSSPNGFDQLFKEAISEIGFPIEVGEIKRPKDNLYAVARGCLAAAEAAED